MTISLNIFFYLLGLEYFLIHLILLCLMFIVSKLYLLIFSVALLKKSVIYFGLSHLHNPWWATFLSTINRLWCGQSKLTWLWPLSQKWLCRRMWSHLFLNVCRLGDIAHATASSFHFLSRGVFLITIIFANVLTLINPILFLRLWFFIIIIQVWKQQVFLKIVKIKVS